MVKLAKVNFFPFWPENSENLHARYLSRLRLCIAPNILFERSTSSTCSCPFGVTPFAALFLFASAFWISNNSFAPSRLPTSILHKHWMSIAAGNRRLLWCLVRFISCAWNCSPYQPALLSRFWDTCRARPAPTMPLGRLKTIMPKTVQQDATSLPAHVVGEMSPYPTL